MNAEEIWAEAVRETNVWMSPHAEKIAEFGRAVIPKYRNAMEAGLVVLDAAIEWRAARVAAVNAPLGVPEVWDRLAKAEHRLSDAVKAIT